MRRQWRRAWSLGVAAALAAMAVGCAAGGPDSAAGLDAHGDDAIALDARHDGNRSADAGGDSRANSGAANGDAANGDAAGGADPAGAGHWSLPFSSSGGGGGDSGNPGARGHGADAVDNAMSDAGAGRAGGIDADAAVDADDATSDSAASDDDATSDSAASDDTADSGDGGNHAADGSASGNASSACDPAVPAPAVPVLTCAAPETKLYAASETPPPPSLVVEIGTVEKGLFVPWAEGAPVPMVHGFQGGLHVVAYARIHRVDGKPMTETKLTLESVGTVGCKAVTAQKVLQVKAVVSKSLPGGLMAPSGGGTWLILPAPATQAKAWCGTWLQATLRVRLPSGDYGASTVTLRLTDP